MPRLGGINLHGSILPAYRGAAPVARAIQRGETETGVTVIRMTPRVDAGGMIAFARTAIDPDETAGELEDRLARLGAPLVVEAIAELSPRRSDDLCRRTKQRVTQGPQAPQGGRPDRLDAVRAGVHNLVRAMQPWPTATTAWHARRQAALAVDRPQDGRSQWRGHARYGAGGRWREAGGGCGEGVRSACW